MKVAVIKTNSSAIHDEEFVYPVVKIIEKEGFDVDVISLKDVKSLRKGKHILTGTSLQDFGYMDHEFDGIHQDAHVLGICAGMHLIAKHYGVDLIKHTFIGWKTLEGCKGLVEDVKEAYFITSYGVSSSAMECLASLEGVCVAFKHPLYHHYGVGFHPEVRNERIIERFLRL